MSSSSSAQSQSMTLSQATDEHLLATYRKTGDRQVFAELVHRYERELYNFLRRYLGDATLAEDAFQATFLQVHLKCEQFDEGRRFRPWLYAVATNQAIDARRRVRRQRMVSLDQSTGGEHDDVLRLVQVLESTEEDPSARLERNERNAAVAQTLQSLPESMMAVVQLVYFQGLKYREAAEILNVPVGTVKSRLNSAIGKLTDVWNAHHVETP
ncbi:MAG: sigma-70 family RNA polymerase sigma factor [Planctomycetales bacterium]|nr:sigma-70 family RNA polymerase sigma factor [Planctomycetales bacterium]